MTDAEANWKLFDVAAKPQSERLYHFHDGFEVTSLIAKINIAMATGRPLLLFGDPGVGKSSVAYAVADVKGWPIFTETIRSNAEADELKAEIDEVQRLADAAVNRDSKQESQLSPADYLRPGPIWQALNPDSAQKNWGERIRPENDLDKKLKRAASSGRVLLLDEIDKGDIDFANDLLDVFDKGTFSVARTGHEVTVQNRERLLIVITSNEARSLSAPFMRRCIVARMERPTVDEAVAIGHAALRQPDIDGSMPDDRLNDLAKICSDAGRLNVSFFVDLVKAAVVIEPTDDDWRGFLEVMQHITDERTREMRGA